MVSRINFNFYRYILVYTFKMNQIIIFTLAWMQKSMSSFYINCSFLFINNFLYLSHLDGADVWKHNFTAHGVLFECCTPVTSFVMVLTDFIFQNDIKTAFCANNQISSCLYCFKHWNVQITILPDEYVYVLSIVHYRIRKEAFLWKELVDYWTLRLSLRHLHITIF